MKPVYFCFGDYRSGKKEYRIFKVRDLQDAYKVADELGYEVILDNCLRFSGRNDYMERMVVSILLTLEIKFNTMENVVSCLRAEYDEAQWMKKHFLNTDVNQYFPKFLEKPTVEWYPNLGFVEIERRMYPWILEYWDRKKRRGELNHIDAVFMDEKTKAMLNEAIREKKK